MCPDFCIVRVFILCVQLYILFLLKRGFIAETWSQNSFFKPRNTEVTESEQEKIIRLVLFSGDRLPDSKSNWPIQDNPEKCLVSWMFEVCGQFPLRITGGHPGFDLAEMIKLLWNQTARSADILAPRVKAPLKTFKYWKRYYHTPCALSVVFATTKLRRLRQRLFTPLMYRRTNLINLPRRHIFISAIWDGGRGLGRARVVRL